MQCNLYCPGETFALLRFYPGGVKSGPPPPRTSMGQGHEGEEKKEEESEDEENKEEETRGLYLQLKNLFFSIDR